MYSKRYNHFMGCKTTILAPTPIHDFPHLLDLLSTARDLLPRHVRHKENPWRLRSRFPVFLLRPPSFIFPPPNVLLALVPCRSCVAFTRVHHPLSSQRGVRNLLRPTASNLVLGHVSWSRVLCSQNVQWRVSLRTRACKRRRKRRVAGDRPPPPSLTLRSSCFFLRSSFDSSGQSSDVDVFEVRILFWISFFCDSLRINSLSKRDNSRIFFNAKREDIDIQSNFIIIIL